MGDTNNPQTIFYFFFFFPSSKNQSKPDFSLVLHNQHFRSYRNNDDLVQSSLADFFQFFFYLHRAGDLNYMHVTEI